MSTDLLKLQTDDSPFLTDPTRSFTLPARFYLDEQIHQLENKAIFQSSWYYAGHSSQLPENGDYLTFAINDQSIFVLRDRAGELKAFYNVCQHRGHELLAGRGRTNVIVCPYHAWSYDLDGSLIGARNSAKMAGFAKCDYSLKPVQVEIFCGLIFVNLDLKAEPLVLQAGELEKDIRQ